MVSHGLKCTKEVSDMKRFEKTVLPMNLQYFADPNPDSDDNPTSPENTEKQSDRDNIEPEGEDNSEQPDGDGKNDAIIEELEG